MQSNAYINITNLVNYEKVTPTLVTCNVYNVI